MPQRNYLQHGSRHRQAGTDPIPTTTLLTPYLNVEEHFTGAMASHSDRTVDWSGSSVDTNDDGTHFSWDFGSLPGIAILDDGPYIIRYYWWILSFSSPPLLTYVMQMFDNDNSLGNDANNNEISIITDTHVAQTAISHETRLSIGSTNNAHMVINFRTQATDDAKTVSEYYAGMTIFGIPPSIASLA